MNNMHYAIRNLNVGAGDEIHLDNINIDLPASGVVTIMGRTLAGKTTLLKVMAGLQAASSGAFLQNGVDLLTIPAWKRRVGMVYQQFVNYPHLNVRDNISFPLKRAGFSAAEIEKKLAYVSELLGLNEYFDRRPAELSGGQQQRVALARSLVKETDLLLLDEPLVNLDYKLREQLRDEFRRIFAVSGDRLVVYATTDPAEAMILHGQVIILHEGKVIQSGDYRDVYHFPANTIAAQVYNDPPMNLLDGEIGDGKINVDGGLLLGIPPHLASLAPGRYVFGIRAIDIAPGGSLRAPLALAEVNGSTTVFHLDLAGKSLVIEQEGVYPLAVGAMVEFSPDISRIYAFDTLSGECIIAPARKSVSGQKSAHGQKEAVGQGEN
ncbi:Glycerol ABC transporter, ATP-binding protein GlpS [hydrothermal vent metagenome]|uniref:Glycerol ABC transporter, ATP-binding protein GlpS n=1 Tax=hydrothermal vent metagenome TaxID=652676 RepID=A0A3B0U818_9ZZZZ